MTPSIEESNSVFEQPWWLDLVAPNQWREILVREDARVVARLPYMVGKGGSLCMPPITQTLGPWIAPEFRKPQSGNEHLKKQKEIITSLMSQIPKNVNFRMGFDSANTYILPYRWHGFSFRPGFSYRIYLDDLIRIKENLSNRTRRDIRYASNRVDISVSTDVDTLWKLLEMTFSKQNRKCPLSETIVKRAVSGAIERGNGCLLVAKDSSENVHSAGFFLFDDRCCYYLLGGMNPEFKSRAQALLLWTAIEKAKEVSQFFDFEGSMVEGIENFFRQFGGYQVINYTVTRLGLLEEMKEILKPRIKRMIGYKI